ncbi:hypothetical protein AKJ54_00640 [candidate division MSBL1 archaeon SCGC-AAA382K21]|uniref:Uncharacterized protein n=1 Tax=candidate division MSBL1 archaeon SCGC-AAA382K21 TaxID=1698283 RepID=A0A133VL37_9EURY|nr:hypothetical protein AKJ54_00640 [candidate division MSBL1 archaeon SCGC-AAA382K21]
MRALQIAFVIILINMSLSIVASANIFGNTSLDNSKITYEPGLIPDASSENIRNETLGSSSQTGLVAWLSQTVGGFTAAMGYVGYLINSLTFNWVWNLIPPFLSNNIVIVTTVTMLNVVLGLLIGVAVIEFILKRYGILN